MTYLRGLMISGCALGLALASGCSGNANFGRDGSSGAAGVLVTGGAGGIPASGGTSATGGHGGGGTGGGPCTDTLDVIAPGYGFACPNDYASAERWPATCSSGHGHLGSCNGYLALLVSPGTWGKECYYDPATRALVGAVAQDDVPSYCNRTSRTIAGGTYPSACPLTLLTDLGECVPGAGGSGSGTGGAGGTAGSGGAGAAGGQSACSATAPCAAGLCVGASCGSGWTCIVDGRGCTDDLADYCGCDEVTFQDSSTCPTRPYAYRGACGQGTNCDPRDVVCNTLPPTCGQLQVPRVVGDCYDGSCVPIDQCLCTVAEECPDRGQYTCFLSANHCTPYLV